MGRICSLLFILFVGLRLTHYIDWSWWWVTAPIWAGSGLWFILWVCYVSYVALWGTPQEKLALYKAGILKL